MTHTVFTQKSDFIDPNIVYSDIMVDIETLGTKPNAPIISIAAQAFDLRSGTLGSSFVTHIDIKSNLEAGRVVDPRTLSWWVDDNSEVFAKWCALKKDPLPIALQRFKIWLLKTIVELRSYQIWGNSNRFDLGILADAYGYDLPWHFYAERDVRTLAMFNEDLKRETKQKFVDAGEDLHNPLTDCKIQIEYCSRIYNDLKPETTDIDE